MRLAPCPAPDQLRDFSGGYTTDEAASTIADHLDECATCRASIAQIRPANDPLLVALREPETNPPYSEESDYRRALQFVAAIGHSAPGDAATLAPERTSPYPEIVRAGPENAVSPLVASASASASAEPPHKRLRDYELLEKLGEGGMGAVYKARHVRLKKIVAIKVLPNDRLADPGAVARFEREMEAVGKLDHPHIVRAMDAGEVDGTHFLVMEYVAGSDLSQLVRERGRLPIREACELIRQAAIGLQAAHEHGMVHRDIKPSNIMLAVPQATPRGQESADRRQTSNERGRGTEAKHQPVVKILDMGLALLSEAHSPDARNLTSTGQMMGTIDYMAPEQGGDSHQVDIRADLYSLGATLYKLLTGEAPFSGEKYDTPVKKLMALATKLPPPVRTRRAEIPGALAALIDNLLAKDPAERLETPEDVAEALAPFAAGADLQGLTSGSVLRQENRGEGPGNRSTSNLGTEATIERPAAPIAASPPPTIAPPPVIPTSQDRVPASKKPAFGGQIPRWGKITAACGAAGLAALLGVLFFIQTDDGVIQVELNDPEIKVLVNHDGHTTFQGIGKTHAIELKPGTHGFTIKRGDFAFKTTDFQLSKRGKIYLSVKYLPGKIQLTDASTKQVIEEWQLPPDPARSVATQGSWLEFDGVDDSVTVPTLRFDGSHPLTMEAWVQVAPDQPQSKQGQTLLGWEGVAKLLVADDRLQSLGFKPGHNLKELRVSPGGVSQLPGWRHVAWVWDGKSLQQFVDGASREVPAELQEMKNSFAENGPQDHFALGCNVEFTKGAERRKYAFFKGKLDEIRISRGARYHDKFKPERRYAPDPDTLALFHFDEGEGTQLKDSSGNNHHGKIVGAKWMPALESETVHQPSGMGKESALVFDGVDDYVLLPKLPYEASAPITFEAFVTPGIASQDVDAEKPTDWPCLWGNGGWFLIAAPFGWQHAHGNMGPFGDPVVAGRRDHVVAQWDGRRTQLFVNGVAGKADDNPAEGSEHLPQVLGCMGDATEQSRFFTGQIDELRISSGARYASNFTPPMGDSLADDDNTLALYHFEEGADDVLKDSSGNNYHGKIVGAKWVKAADADRRAAEWVLSNGGDIQLRHNGERRQIFSTSDLPAGPIQLVAVSMPFNAKVNDAGLANLAGCRYLEALDISGVVVSDTGLAWLKDSTQLISLWLQATEVTEAGLAVFKNCPLGELQLSHAQVTQAKLSQVNLKQVTILLLFESNLDDSAWEVVAEDCPNLAILDLRSTQLTDARLERLTGLRQLASLKLNGTQVTAAGVQKFAAALPACRIEWDGGTIEPKSATGAEAAAAEQELRFKPEDKVEIPSLKIDRAEAFTFEGFFTPAVDKPGIPETLIGADYHGIGIEAGGHWHFGWVTDEFHAIGWTPCVAGRRVHVAGVHKPDALLLFIDGKLQANDPVTASSSQLIQLNLGGGFTGRTDEMRVSKGARYEKDFPPLPPNTRFEPDDQTVALYHFDEGQGDILKDSSGNNHHGKILGAEWAKLPAGKSAAESTTGEVATGALSFDGRSYVDIPTLEFENADPLTFEAWVTPQDQEPDGTLFHSIDAPGFHLAKKKAAWAIGNGGESVGWVPVEPGKRVHVAGIRDTRELRFYLDGKRIQSQELPEPLRMRRHGGRIGAMLGDSPAEFFQGRMDEFRLSKVARYTADFVPAQRLIADENTIALYHFDDGQGEILADTSGNNHHGKIVGARWASSSGQAAGGPIDLLPKINLDGFGAPNMRWERTANGLSGEGIAKESKADWVGHTFPDETGTNYDLEFEFEQQGFWPLQIHLPLGDRAVCIDLSPDGSGIFLIDGKERQQQAPPQRNDDAKLRTGVPHKLVAKVRNQGDDVSLDIKLDGENLAQFSGERKRISLPPWVVPDKKRVRLTSQGNLSSVQMQIRRAVVTPVTASPATAEPPRAIAPFDAAQGKAHQEVWAQHLGVPVEYENSIGMKFRLIPPGEYMMGSTQADIDALLKTLPESDSYARACLASEGPQHKAILTRPFYLAVNEVTQEQYVKVQGMNPSFFAKSGVNKELAERVAQLDPARHPVEGVIWTDAEEFIQKLGNGYRLPTEAEWEFACRAGSTARYIHGEEEDGLSVIAWWGKNSGSHTHPVGELQANPFGLHDMTGGVWEWTSDAFDPGYFASLAAAPAVDPQGPALNDRRVIRGGSWWNPAILCRAASRVGAIATDRVFDVGIRVALSVDTVRLELSKTAAVPPAAVAPVDAAQANALEAKPAQ